MPLRLATNPPICYTDKNALSEYILGEKVDMKKGIAIVLAVVLFMALTACSNEDSLPKPLEKEGIAPYAMSESEAYILEAFNLEDTAQMLSFRAPEAAISLNVHVYRLGDGGAWAEIGGGGISIGTERIPDGRLTGTFTMRLAENYSIDFNINANGRASYKIDEIVLENEVVSSTKGFLQNFQAIELNTEIPVAFMVYDGGTSMESYTLEDYFKPSEFEGMDLVQFVTLEFSDK